MIRATLTTLILTMGVSASLQAQSPVTYADEVPVEEYCQDCESCSKRDYFRGWLFRKYAGSVEMETKTPFPQTYYGTYTYLPWSPDWVRTPANSYRQSFYRHHVHHAGARGSYHSPQVDIPAIESLPEIKAPQPATVQLPDSTLESYYPRLSTRKVDATTNR